MSDDMKEVKPDEPAADPGPPNWPKAGVVSRALAWSAWAIRKRNRAAVLNPITGNIERTPL